MKSWLRSLVGALLLVPALAAQAEAPAWMKTLDEGLAAAKKSGKPLLVVTLWKEGV